jgi:hypothetical protein
MDRFVRLVTDTDTTIAEFWGSTTLLLMGFWFILPYRTFDTIPAYHIMAEMMDEEGWGLCTIFLGLVQAVGNITKRYYFRVPGAFFASVMYLFVASLAISSEPASLLAPICGTASFVEGLVYLRLSFLKDAVRGGP